MSEDEISSAGEALRQAMLDALREIETRIAGDAITPGDVHLARRAAKRARALARLAPADLATLARNTRTTVDRARRALGQARDADVRAATLGALKPRLGDASHDRLVRLARGASDGERAGADRPALREDIAALIRDWRLCEARGSRDDIVDAASTTYRRMWRRAKRARDGKSKALHRWRAAVVAFEYQADFLARFAPDMQRVARDADRLRKHLGKINDLDELAGYIEDRAAHDDDREAARHLARASATRRKRLLARALAIAEPLLARKPAQWLKDVRRSCAR